MLGYAVTLLPILPLYLDTLLHPYNLTFLTSLLVYCVTCLPRYLFAQLPRDRGCLFTPLPRHILTSLHRKFATSLPLYTATSLPRYLFLVSLLPRYRCTSLHLELISPCTSSPCYVVTPLLIYLVASLPRYSVNSIPRYLVTLLHRYLFTPLHRYLVTTLPHYLVTSLPPVEFVIPIS